MGDVSQADYLCAAASKRLVQEARGSPNPNWRRAYSIYGHSWEADAKQCAGGSSEARGQYAEAEAAYRRAEAFRRAAVNDLAEIRISGAAANRSCWPRTSSAVGSRANEAKQGRLSEAEATRAARFAGNTRSAGQVQSRRPQHSSSGSPASWSSRAVTRKPKSLRGRRSMCSARSASPMTRRRPPASSRNSATSSSCSARRRKPHAVYAQLDKAIAQWTPQQREAFELNGSRIAALYAAGQVEAGIAAAEDLVKRQTARTGENSFDTRVGARRCWPSAMPAPGATPTRCANSRLRDPGHDDGGARERRRRRSDASWRRSKRGCRELSKPISACWRAGQRRRTMSRSRPSRSPMPSRPFGQQFARGFERAYWSAKDPRSPNSFAASRISPSRSTPHSARSTICSRCRRTSATRTDVRATSSRDREAARRPQGGPGAKSTGAFPSYADLIDPKPPSVDEIKATLRPGEAMLSFYFGQDASFVWAVPKDGAVAFARGAGDGERA